MRPVATPLSVGLAGLAAATFVVSGLNLGWISSADKPHVGLILMTFTALLQLIATIYGFLTRDSVAATGMGILSGTWFATGLVFFFSSKPTDPSLGLLLFAAATALLVPAVGAMQSKMLAAVVLLTTSVRWFVTGAYEMTGASGWKTAAGWIGLALFLLAVLAALVFEIEDAKRRPLKLAMRRGKGKEALAGDVWDEFQAIHHEAGVREVL